MSETMTTSVWRDKKVNSVKWGIIIHKEDWDTVPPEDYFEVKDEETAIGLSGRINDLLKQPGEEESLAKEEEEKLLNFGEVVALLKQGYPLQRKGWNGNGLFIYKQIRAWIGKEGISHLKSVPERVKKIILAREKPAINYTNQVCIVHLDGRVDSWVPSVSDMFAEDWRVVEENI